tara:strand:- start:9022 stop:9522 length:501 start_codon:yes stop_codon:yes gene_type:complete
MLVSVLLVLFLLLLLYILFVPIIVCIETATNQYYVRVQGLAKLSVQKHEKEIVRFKIQALFRTFYFYPLRLITAKQKKHSVKQASEKSKKQFTAKQFLSLMKSFKVKHFHITIDTGDCILNAKLFPLMVLLNYYKGDCSVNFENKNSLALQMKNRPIYIIKSFINS